MSRLHVDIETYSRENLKDVGVYRYAEDEHFQILMASWSLDGSPLKREIGEDAIKAIPGLLDSSVTKVAHNAAFERVCFSRLFGMPTGTYLDPEDWHDTMAVAAEKGYPRSLGPLAEWLGGEQKDEAGTRLINLFCKPNRAGRRVLPAEKPEEWEQFGAYCDQDVVTLISVDEALGDFPTEIERQVYTADQRINDRGVYVDVELAEEAADAADDNRMVQELEVMTLTGIDNPGSLPQLLGWLKGQGLPMKDMKAETVEIMLRRKTLSAEQRRVLELRQELALVASKKYLTAKASVCDDHRLRGSFRFFGAHTGRWAGRGVQMHNLPRESFQKMDLVTGKLVHDEETEEASILDVKIGLGASSLNLKKMVRPLFTGPFTVVDYASIEARVIAWLAGEEWALQAFRDGRDIYVETAERMSSPGHPMSRSDGKVAVLALGYNGGVGSLKAMGADGNDAVLQVLVNQWRNTNPSIVDLWAQMGEAFLAGGEVGELLRVERDGETRSLVLPSGRAIVYHGVQLMWLDTPYGRRRVPSFRDPQKNGFRVPTYGGRLSENVTQAVARDVLAEALVRLVQRGHSVVGHVHDEILVEGIVPVSTIQSIMTEQPAWAAGLPINAEGFLCRRYRKG